MSETINVLDHGYVTLRNMAGPTRRSEATFDANDVDIANAARMSFDASDNATRSYAAEMKLTRYLLVNQHMTPFESIEVWLEMKLPIFVARQFVRQRTQSINEVSGRYVTLPPEWYIPAVIGMAPKDKKQGQTGELDASNSAWFRAALQNNCLHGYESYSRAIIMGVAPEHARLFLHVNHYTHWMTKMNLRNLMLSFLALRDHAHAQIEAQIYAQATVKLLAPHIPGIMQLYSELIKQGD